MFGTFVWALKTHLFVGIIVCHILDLDIGYCARSNIYHTGVCRNDLIFIWRKEFDLMITAALSTVEQGVDVPTMAKTLDFSVGGENKI